MKKISILLFFISLTLPTYALGQVNLGGLNTQTDIITFSPSFPQPNDTVTASINLNTSNFYGAAVSWYINDVEITEAKNQKTLTFKAGEAGSIQAVEVVLNKIDGTTQTAQKDIKPLYLDIVLEPQTRVPDFYQGRSLPSIGSIVNATAIINGNKTSPNNLVYSWKINNQVINGGSLRSGYKTYFEVPMGQNFSLSLTVTDLAGAVLGQRSISVNTVTPKVVFYENNILTGINPTALSKDFYLVGETLAIKAEPFNLDSRVYNNPNYYTWKIDSISYPGDTNNPYEITIQKNETVGSAAIEYEVRDRKQILQGAEGGIKINF